MDEVFGTTLNCFREIMLSIINRERGGGRERARDSERGSGGEEEKCLKGENGRGKREGEGKSRIHRRRSRTLLKKYRI